MRNITRTILVVCVSLVLGMPSFAQGWTEQTRDAAYEAPDSYLQKKWYSKGDGYTEEIQYFPDGTVMSSYGIRLEEFNDTRLKVICTGKYSRKKDILITKYTSIKLVPNPSDVSLLSSRKKADLQVYL